MAFRYTSAASRASQGLERGSLNRDQQYVKKEREAKGIHVTRVMKTIPVYHHRRWKTQP